MSFADANFMSAVQTLLTNPSNLGQLNFSCPGGVFGTLSYMTIGELVRIKRVKCLIDDNKLPAGAAAIYDPNSNTIYGGTTFDIRNNKSSSTIIHESTHAIVDMWGGFTHTGVRNLNNEIAGFLAGAIFSISSPAPAASNSGVKVTGGPQGAGNAIMDAALAIVKTKGVATNSTANNGATPLAFSAQECTKLAAAIQADKLYADWNTVSNFDGIN